MKKLLPVCIILPVMGFLFSCKSSVEYRSLHYSSNNTIPASIHISGTGSPEKVALILPTPFDSIDWTDNALVHLLKKQDYTVVLAENYEHNSLFNRVTWLQYIYVSYIGLVEDSLVSAHPESFLLLGFEDAGYIVPELSRFLNPTAYFAINAGPFSPLKEVLLLAKDTSASLQPFFRKNNILNREELAVKLEKVMKNAGLQTDLGYKSNDYWMSFYQTDNLTAFGLLKTPGFFVFSEEYPFLRKTSKAAALALLPKGNENNSSQIIHIPGNGNFKDEGEMKELANVVKEYLSNLQ